MATIIIIHDDRLMGTLLVFAHCNSCQQYNNIMYAHAKGVMVLKNGRKAFHFRRWFPLVFLLLALLVLACAAQRLEKTHQYPETRGDPSQRLVLENRLLNVDGRTYAMRSELTTILLMGVDRERQTVPQGYRNGGQADFLMLLVLDHENRTISQIAIDRDTMTPITVLGVTGKTAGERKTQICLAHGFGDGYEQSCELTAKAVSRLLCSIPVDLYLALNMDGISVLNDELGGITVTLTDDFSALDEAMRPGVTLTLQGRQAEYYVRSRMNIGLGTNDARMLRQETYLARASERLCTQVTRDKEYIGELYDALSPYLTTNISRGRLINEVWNARQYRNTGIYRLPGEHVTGRDGFVEFHVDHDALKQIVTKLFCREVE